MTAPLQFPLTHPLTRDLEGEGGDTLGRGATPEPRGLVSVDGSFGRAAEGRLSFPDMLLGRTNSRCSGVISS